MSKNPNHLNLDQLLDFKRSEKPSDEFWDGFQKEFKQRQLQTLIEKESNWYRYARLIFARSSVLIPLSGLAVALFVLVVNFQESSHQQNEYFETANLTALTPQPSFIEATSNIPEIQVHDEIIDFAQVQAIPADARFVMDLITNEEPESLSYTRAFPTSAIPIEKRVLSSLVSYSIARDGPSFGMARPQTIGF